MVLIDGIEIVPWEFKELLLDLAMRLKDLVDAEPGKLKSLIRKFMSSLFLRRLQPFIQFTNSKQEESKGQEVSSLPARQWPQSKKDEDIQVIIAEKSK